MSGTGDRHVITLLKDARAMLAEKEGAGPVYARVLARLTAALRDQPERGPRDTLSREAVAIARRFNDPSTLAYTLADRGAALYGPDNRAGRLAIAEELRAVGHAAQDRELELRGEDDRAMVLLETGRIAEYREAIGALQRLAAEMRAPWAQGLAAARGRPAGRDGACDLPRGRGVSHPPAVPLPARSAARGTRRGGPSSLRLRAAG